MEEGGEGVAVSVHRLFTHGRIGLIGLLIAGLGALPAYHCVALGSDERSSVGGELESGSLLLHYEASCFAAFLARDYISECNIVVANLPFDAHLLSGFILEGGDEGVGVVVDMALLDAVLVVAL